MKRLDAVLLVLLMALWGFNFSIIKLGVNSVNPLVLTALRFSFAVFPVIFFIPRPAVQWRYLVMYGLSFGVGVWGLTTLAVHAGNSLGMTSLLLDMSVVSALLLGWLVLKETITAAKLIGSATALLGLAVIIYFDDGMVTPLGLVLVLAASTFWTVNNLIVKLSGTRSVFAFNVWSMLFAPVPLLVLAVVIYGPEVVLHLPQQMTAGAWFSALFQAYPTTLLGYWFWNKMIVRYSISLLAPINLLVVVFGILGGVLFWGEVIEWPHVVATVLILGGILISQMNIRWAMLRAKPVA
ncbi:EamA family transporter [Saccharospirillum mangrovi]|uniref:EamA family transporter n=1 Tax=Saccharospirillum mangrovi TaxID=2161747 RepID=UPI000D36C38A|nr:EamA family transporter [Saccharospirillum mangrovi]